MATTPQNDSIDLDLAELFQDFHKRHHDGKGRKLKFTVWFNRALDGLIDSPAMCLEARALGWIVRYSWGNNSDIAVEKPGGRPLRQQDFADRTGVRKQRASEVFNFLRKNAFLSPEEADSNSPFLRPSDNPAPTHNRPRAEDSPSAYQQWCEQEWRVSHPEDYADLKSAEDTVQRLRKVRLGLWKNEKRRRTNQPRILSSLNSKPLNPVSQSVELASQTETPPTHLQSNLVDEIKILLVGMLAGKLGDVPSRQCCLEVEANLQGAPLRLLEERIRLRLHDIKSFGMVPLLAKDVGAAHALSQDRGKIEPAPKHFPFTSEAIMEHLRCLRKSLSGFPFLADVTATLDRLISAPASLEDCEFVEEELARAEGDMTTALRENQSAEDRHKIEAEARRATAAHCSRMLPHQAAAFEKQFRDRATLEAAGLPPFSLFYMKK